MKPNIRAILEDCIERGIEQGLARSKKHTDDPTDSQVIGSISDHIWLHLDEYFLFEDGF